jgi:cell division protein FtsZ
MNVIHESADDDADIMFGTSTDDDTPENYVKITIIATGFEKELNKGINTIESPTKVVEESIKIQPRLVVGGDLNGDYLDIPAYMRKQQD